MSVKTRIEWIRLFRSNSSVSSKSSVPSDIINEEDYAVEETDLIDFS